MLWTDALDTYLAEVTPQKAASTRRHDRYYASILAGLRLDVADLTASEVDQLHRRISIERGPVVANRAISLVSQVCDLAERRGWRDTANPTRAIRRNREPKRTAFLRLDQRARLVDAVHASIMAGEISVSAGALMMLMLLVGLRWSEARELRWSEVDLDAGMLRIAARGDGRTSNKSGDERSVPLSDRVVDLLASLPRWSQWVAPSPRSRRPYTDLRKAIARVEARSGLKFRCHQLRHSYGTACAEAGLTPSEIGACLGHRSPATAHRYVHLAGKPARAAAQRASIAAAGGER
jgi:integrase